MRQRSFFLSQNTVQMFCRRSRAISICNKTAHLHHYIERVVLDLKYPESQISQEENKLIWVKLLIFFNFTEVETKKKL